MIISEDEEEQMEESSALEFEDDTIKPFDQQDLLNPQHLEQFETGTRHVHPVTSEQTSKPTKEIAISWEMWSGARDGGGCSPSDTGETE